MKMGNNNKDINEDKSLLLGHLQLIQESICRMSTISSVFKGFSAAILGGLATASFNEISKWALLIGLFPILSFLFLDIYYLRLEKKLRYRYNRIATGKEPVNFLVNPILTKEEIKDAKAGIMECIKSPSVLLFYVPVLICCGILVFLKFTGKL